MINAVNFNEISCHICFFSTEQKHNHMANYAVFEKQDSFHQCNHYYHKKHQFISGNNSTRDQ